MVSLKKILNKILVRINSEADYVVEEGQNESSSYRKWNSGKAEFFWVGKNYFDSPTAVGNLYRVEVDDYLPSIFITNPDNIYVSPIDSSKHTVISMNGYAIDSGTIRLYAWLTTSQSIYVSFSYYIIGNWK